MKTIIANLKMNLTLQEMIDYIKKLNYQKKFEDKQIIVCPSYPYVSIMSLALDEQYYIGSQDVSMYSNGQYTGDVSAEQLSSISVTHCIIGHSERKIHYNESELETIEKIKRVQEQDIIPIICIDDNINEILSKIIPNIKKENNIIIAYEPISAIGTGKMPSIEDIIKNITNIKDILKETYNITPKVIYGGSVDILSCKNILESNIIDGVLIGKNSTNIEEFINLLKEIEVLK